MNSLEQLKKGGVVGGGGAGFPTWKKLSTPAKTLLINGAECEPLLISDQYLMLCQADDLVRAARRLGDIISAEQVAIALKDHYVQQLEAIKEAIARLGLDVRVYALPTVYPVGDEQAVVYECLGEAVPPGGLPGSVGATVVSVSTALGALAALDGVPVTRRLLTVAGEVISPGLYDVPVGTQVMDVIAAAGGMAVSDARILLGGPMMGTLLPKGDGAVVTKTCGGILVLEKDHRLVRMGSLSPGQMQGRAKACCIQCRCCTDLCPRFLLGHPIYPHLTMRSFAMGGKPEPSAVLCMECGVCELFACPMGLSPRRIQQMQKQEFRREGEKFAFSVAESQQSMRAWRQLPSARLEARIDVERYAVPLPEMVHSVSPESVYIPLSQHIGTPAEACVQPGERVLAGQVIGVIPEQGLGAYIHASIDGRVTEVSDKIAICREAG